MSKLEVDTIAPQSGTTVTVGESGDTVTIPTGVTLDASNATTTLPSNIVTTDGSQTLTNKTIDASQLSGTITPSDGTVSTAKIVDGAITSAKLGSGVGGKVLQVVSATKTDTQAFSSSTFSDVNGLSLSITPSSTSSKILVFGYAMVAWDSALAKIAINLLRGSTNILIGDAAGSRQRVSGFTYLGIACNGAFSLPFNFLDSPSTTSAITYKIQASSLDNAGNVYVNRSFVDTDNSTFARTTSTITAMEISA